MVNATEGVGKVGERNPGTFLDLNKRFVKVLPVIFDGLRVSIHRGQDSYFNVNHKISYSSTVPGNHRLEANHNCNRLLSETGRPSTVSRNVYVGGNTNVAFSKFGSRCQLNYTGQTIGNSFVANQLEAHYLADSYTISSIILSNANLSKPSGSFKLQYLQNVSPILDVGFELKVSKNTTSKENFELNYIQYLPSIVWRYKTPGRTWCAVLGKDNFLLTCHRQVSQNVSYGLELCHTLRPRETTGALATKVRLPDKGLTFQAMIDTRLIGAVCEKKISDFPIALALSTYFHPRTSHVRFGLGITIE